MVGVRGRETGPDAPDARSSRMSILDRIYPRIFLPLVAALVVGAAAAWWVASSLVGDALERRLENQLMHATEVLAAGGIPLTDDVLSRVVRLLDADVVLLDADGKMVRTTLARDDVALLAAILDAWRAFGRAPAARTVTLPGSQTHVAVFRPVDAARSGAAGQTLVAVASLAAARGGAREAAWWLGAAAVGITALLAAIGHRIARGITEPVSALAAMAGRIASGDRDVRADVTRPREIGALAAALNQMTARLEDYEQEVAERNRLAALGEMAARVAHEIRNPLTAIKLQVEILGERQDAPQSHIASLLDEIRRLELVVASTLSLHRPLQLATRPVDLNTLVREVASLMAPQFEHRGVTLETDLAALPSVELDPDRIKQVIFNLLVNATDALPGGGTVRVCSSAQDGEAILLSVDDSGPGITEAVRERLFSHVLHDSRHGSGVGLLISKEIIELHGGSITVDTSPPLGGARFTIALPLPAAVTGEYASTWPRS